jgi:hypothetical protein
LETLLEIVGTLQTAFLHLTAAGAMVDCQVLVGAIMKTTLSVTPLKERTYDSISASNGLKLQARQQIIANDLVFP